MSSKITKYLISTFLCSWIMWGLVALGGRFGITYLTFGNPIGMILYVFGGVSPAICEIVIQKRSCNKEEFKKFLKSIMNPKHSIWLYLYAIGGAILIQSIPVITGYSTIKLPFYMGFILILPMVIGGGLEEIGWKFLMVLYKCAYIIVFYWFCLLYIRKYTVINTVSCYYQCILGSYASYK